MRVHRPHLPTLHRRNKRNRTGCIGISIHRPQAGHRAGKTYLVVSLGGTHAFVNVTRLGMAEAWRRAVAARARFEEERRAGIAAILEARSR